MRFIGHILLDTFYWTHFIGHILLDIFLLMIVARSNDDADN